MVKLLVYSAVTAGWKFKEFQQITQRQTATTN